MINTRRRSLGSERLSGCVVAALSVLGAETLFAQQSSDASYYIETGAIRTDNAQRLFNNPVDDNIAYAELGTNLAVDRRRLDASLSANGRFNTYLDDSFSDEFLFNGSGNLNFTFVPDVFEWSASTVYSQALLNVLVANTPDNREDVNVFTTGPRLTLPVARATAVQLSAQYSDRYFEIRETDNSDILYSGALVQTLSSGARLSLELSTQETEFDAEGLREFERRNAALRFASETVRTGINVAVGTNEIEIGGETQSTPSIDVELSRRTSPRTTLTLGYNQQFADGSRSFQALLEAPELGSPVNDVFLIGVPNETRILRLGSSTEYQRTTIGLSVFNEDVSSVTLSDQSRETLGASFSVCRQIAYAGYATLAVSYTERDFVSVSDDTTWVAGFNISNRVTRNVTVSLGLQHQTRDADIPTFSFDENRISLSIRYSRD